MKVRRLEDREWRAEGALASQWRTLLERSTDRSVFLSVEWADSWWQTYGRAFEPVVLGAFDDAGELCGLAPLMIGHTSGLSGRLIRRLMPIGQPSYSEYPDLIVPTGVEPSVAPALLEHLRDELGRKWDVWVMQRMLASSPTVALAPSVLRDTARVEVSPRSMAAYLPLPASWEEYLASQSSNFRQMYRNSENRLARAGSVRTAVAEQDVSFDDAFDALVRLHDMRFQGGSFARPGYEEFHRAFARRMLARGGLYLALLMLDDEPIAARYDFVHGSKMWQHQGGWDDKFQAMRPGIVSIGGAIQWGIEHGQLEYDFLAGDHAYKQRWTTHQRELVNVVAVNRRTLRGRAYRALRS